MPMELTNKRVIRELLKKYNARPEKHLGQHFILSKKAFALMITAAEINSDAQRGRSSDRKRRRKTDTIIEIGQGLGTLTQELAKTCANVIAIEKDPLMIKILKETLADYKNVKIIQADARQMSLFLPGVRHRVKSGKDVDKFNKYNRYKIAANLPYNIATFLIRQWLESGNPPQMMVLMIQKEVARRIVAKPPRANLLGVSVQFYADAEIIDYIKKESFWPKPKVDAAIIKIIPHSKKGLAAFASDRKQMMTDSAIKAFFSIVKAGFFQPRKQLIGNLLKKLNIPKEQIISTFKNLDISKKIRAENLSLNDWQKLASELIHN